MRWKSLCGILLGLASASLGQPGWGDAVSYSLVPPRATPEQPFSLWLLSESFNCASRFSHLSVNLSEGAGRPVLTLSFYAYQDSLVKCAETPGDVYGPQFKSGAAPLIPSLKAGVYDVVASRKLLCQVEAPFCGGPPVRLESAGTLTVAAGGTGWLSDSSRWFAKPRRVKPNMRFTLQALNEFYGDCNYAFTDTAMTVENGSIHLASVIRHYPQRLCVKDFHPAGPAVDVKGLAAGVYPVYFRELRACEVENPPCISLPLPETLIDTLTVAAAVSVLPRAGAAAAPTAFLRGNQLFLDPAGWRGTAELFSLSGRRLQRWGVAGERMRAAMPGLPERGFYLLRLHSPERGTLHLKLLAD